LFSRIAKISEKNKGKFFRDETPFFLRKGFIAKISEKTRTETR